MDGNDTLYWLVGLSAGVLGLRVATQRPVPRGWLTVLALLGGVLATGAKWFPATVGYVGLALWLVLVLLPTVCQRQALRLAATRRSRLARVLAEIATRLHPTDGWPATRQFVQALAALREGHQVEGDRRLMQLRAERSALGPAAMALQVRIAGDWEGYLRFVESHPAREQVLADDALWDLYLQALGETGRRVAMLQEFGRQRGRSPLPAAQLHVAALCGETATAQALLRGSLRHWPPEAVDFWEAVARQAAGDRAADTVLQRLADSSNRLFSGPARRRLAQPLSPLADEPPADVVAAVLSALHLDTAHEAQFAVLSSTPHRSVWVTYVIAVLLSLNFLRELPQGSENQDNLIELGAIVIPRQAPWWAPWEPSYDEWWRPITAAFLHFGWLHFLMNLLGLLYLGTRLERAWGPWRTLICYAAAVGVSMTVTPWLLEQGTGEPQILAGASGGIMGLLGGLLGYLLIGRRRRRTPEVSRQLSLVLGFVLLQTLFDLSHEQVSHQAHLLGLATGVVLGLVVGQRTPGPVDQPRSVMTSRQHAATEVLNT